ncbi:MAG: hypothetical protein MI684_07505 [Chlorobiales bacterium]|nr:hypothetical protein [Chlorobiales bacterium]
MQNANKNRLVIEPGAMARIYLSVSVVIITAAAFLGAAGAWTGSAFLNTVHPYVFFTGFGNLAILILNRYLISVICPELEVDPEKQMRYLYGVLLSLFLVVLAVYMNWPLLKALVGLFLIIIVSVAAKEIFSELFVGRLWREVSARYYIFDVIFLLVANLGLFTLGLKEAFPETGIIPFFVTQSSYFLGSSFPLSISVMGFLYTYVWRRSSKAKLIKQLFSIWFYVFVSGVLVFLIAILMGNYIGMMLVSHTLMFGVIVLLIGFARYLHRFFSTQFRHPALAFLLSGLAMLFAASAYGILNIYFFKSFGAVPPIPEERMWIYHSHTHAALLGWITFSFTGMIYIVVPAIVKSNSLELLRSEKALSQLLDEMTLSRAFGQLTIAFVSATSVLLAFYLKSNSLMAFAGVVFGFAVYYSRVNLGKAFRGLSEQAAQK